MARKGRGSKLASITNLLRRPQIAKAIYGQHHTVPTSGITPIKLFITTEVQDTVNTDRSKLITVPLNNIRHLSRLADTVMKNTPANAQVIPVYNSTVLDSDIRFKMQISGSANYLVRNQSTDLVRVRAYYCRARQDFNVTNWAAGTTNVSNMFNIYDQLARGFAVNGLDPGNFTADVNTAMFYQHHSVFESVLFCQNWKIYKKKSVTIFPGRIANFHIKNKPFTWRPSKYLESYGNASAVFRSANPVYNHMRYEKFILFQVESSPAGFGIAQTTANRLISHNTPTVILETGFTYKFNALQQGRTPHATIEVSGFIAQSATANTIVNPDEGTLSEEKDAV